MVKANEIQHGGDHYKGSKGLQHWDICARYNVGYLEGCATKYVSRHRKKNGLEDIHKADHYLMKILEEIDDHRYIPIGGGVPADAIKQFCLDNDLDYYESEIVKLVFTWSDEEALQEARKHLGRIKREVYGEKS